MEQWHPLGPVGVITAFNFPVAVWAWNAALALVCGDSVVWKPSEKAPLSALAVPGAIAHTLAEMRARHRRVLRAVIVGAGREVGAGARRSPTRAADLRDRFGARWAARSPSASLRGWAARCSNWAATTA